LGEKDLKTQRRKEGNGDRDNRPELCGYWDFSVFLDVPFHISIPRGAQRGEGSPDPQAPENHRYIEGQRLYLHTCESRLHATIIIDNEHLASPKIVAR